MEASLTLFVATDGDDRWSGTAPAVTADGADGPLATLARARDALRGLRAQGEAAPVTVLVRGGTYRLTEPLVLTPEDSGTPGCPVTYRAYPGEQPLLSGGRLLGPWRRREDGLWEADATSVVGPDGACRQLFLNGRRVQRARRPRDGYFLVPGMLPDAGQPLTFPWQGEDLDPKWADGHTEIVVLHNWYEQHQTLVAADPETRQATLSGVSRNSGQVGPRYRVENVAAGLEEPGTWYYDWRARTILYRPLPNEDLTTAEAVVPVLSCLVDLAGDLGTGQFVEHVHFEGLTFSHTAWALPPGGHNDGQAASSVPGAVQANVTRSCAFEQCRFEHVGGYGLEFTTGCKGNRVVDCELHDLGAGGIKIGEMNRYEDPQAPQITRSTEVTRCHIHDYGQVYPAAVGVFIAQSPGNQVTHNHIHDGYYTGVSAGWTWGYDLSNTRDNLIAHNHIHDIGRGLLSDMGGIYLLGRQPGTVLRGNVIHDILSYEGGYGGWGIYLDEGCTEVLVEDNLVYRTKSGGFHQHYGRDNLIRNNVFAFSREGQILRTRQEDHLSFTLERNIVYCDREFPLSGNWTNGQFRLDYNLYYRRDGQGATCFHAPLVYLGLRPFPSTFLGEAAHYDLVGLNPNGPVAAVDYPDLRFLGVIPQLAPPEGHFPSEEDWESALVLPYLVNVGGEAVRLGETETRLFRTEEDLFLSVLCRYSRLADRDPGMSNDSRQENIEVFLKPDPSRDASVQLFLKVDGTALTYYHPADAWGPVAWEGRGERTDTGWRALLRVPIAQVGVGDLWQIFVGRYGLLPPLTFAEWQATGQDQHSLVADPLFVAPEQGDFRLREDSPARSLRFRPFAALSGEIAKG